MREIEIKLRVEDFCKTEQVISSLYGKGRVVEKKDLYFRRPGEIRQALRMRNNNGLLEFTAKKTSVHSGVESNFEYEFSSCPDEWERARAFFLALGFEQYFMKLKTGYEWMCGRIHAELFKVNDIGSFLELEIILPEDASEAEIEEARLELVRLYGRFGLSFSDVEEKSYREMITGR